MSGTDGLMDGGLVNVSEAERSLVNSPLTQSTGLIPYVCVCLVHLGSVVSRRESDLTQPLSLGRPAASSAGNMSHTMYS